MRARLQPSDTTQAGATTAKANFSSYSLFLPYFLPYAAYVVIANLPFDLSKECNYTLRLLVVSAILAWGWGWYLPLCRNSRTSASVLSGIVYGSVGVPIWVLLCKPFAPPDAPIWDMWGFLFRLAAACTIVPIAEEYLFRGYVFRLASLWDAQRKLQPKNAFQSVLFERSINEIEQLKWSLPAVAISGVAFTLGHQVWEWPAAVVYGTMMCVLAIKQQSLIACVVAHAITNLGLGAYVFFMDQWQYW